jgi:hypothetical protein
MRCLSAITTASVYNRFVSQVAIIMLHKAFYFIVLLLLATACSLSTETHSTLALQTIPVELTTHLGDQQQFIDGDEIQFLLSLGSDAYIYMYYIDASNNITKILPNENQHSHFYSAGYFLTVPNYKNHYRFIISRPYGEESIWIFASDQSINFNETNIGIDEIRNNIKNASRLAYGEYAMKIVTHDR